MDNTSSFSARKKILVTGSSGLVGSELRRSLTAMGFDIVGLDLRGDGDDFGSTLSEIDLVRATEGCVGIVHLAAVSRVLWGEENPELCWSTNVLALKSLMNIVEASNAPPWMIFASSREVYGEPQSFPVTEQSPLSPINVYAESKVEGERIVEQAKKNGIKATTVRLSNVYGSTEDHADRVVPAFVVNSLMGKPLRVDGEDHVFDFNHLSDTVDGIVRLVVKMVGHCEIPTIHFVSGTGTTLRQLADTCLRVANSDSELVISPPRNFDVCNFVGNFERATQFLDWKPKVTLEEGVSILTQKYRTKLGL